MTYQSTYLNLELKTELAPKRNYSFTLELKLKELRSSLFTLFFVTPDLTRSVGPGQIKQVVGRNPRQYPL